MTTRDELVAAVAGRYALEKGRILAYGRSPTCLYRPSTRSFSQPRLCSEPHKTPDFLPLSTRTCKIRSNSMIEAASMSKHALQRLHATRSRNE